MAQALILPLIEKGKLKPEDLFAVVGSQESVLDLHGKLPEGLRLVDSQAHNASEVWLAPLQLLAVKPQQLDMVAASSGRTSLDRLSEKPILISLLAGVRLDRLEQLFPHHLCVRAIPNTPALVGEGLTGFSWSKKVNVKQRRHVKEFFSEISELFDIPESQMDAFLALASSGPAYIALIAEALADGAVAAGLPRSLAIGIAYRTISGTTSLLREKKLHPGQLKDMVASPGGTTIAGIRKLEQAGLRSALIEAIVATAQRSSQMS